MPRCQSDAVDTNLHLPGKLYLNKTLTILAGLAVGGDTKWHHRIERYRLLSTLQQVEHRHKEASQGGEVVPRPIKARIWRWVATKRQPLEYALKHQSMLAIDVLAQVIEIEMSTLLARVMSSLPKETPSEKDDLPQQTNQRQIERDEAANIWRTHRRGVLKELRPDGAIKGRNYSLKIIMHAMDIESLVSKFCKHSAGLSTESTHLAAWSASLLDLPECLKYHLEPLEQDSMERIYEQLDFSVRAAVTLEGILEIAHFWTIEFIVQRSLGPNPAFNFIGYDMHNDGQAREVPSWLDAHWYRQLVTPETTPYPLTSAEEFWLKAPFLETAPPAIIWPATEEQLPTSWARESLHKLDDAGVPHGGGSHVARELARIGLCAQRRYRIRHNDWASRWSEAQ
ncbi:hypothetical protein JCM10908_001962 [Rhodotorula pacifica]|uniref:uncharacterized protein n=1 Tax=Rhodotorula pacifica TaxID=1495444 RepID=UPI00317E7D72